MIIYELESDYASYLAALGAPTKLVRKYAYRNALLPQITGLALALGAVVSGAIVVEIVFSLSGSRDADAERDPEPRLLPHPGHLPLPDRRRPDRQPHHRHRLRPHRPADADRHAGRRVMARRPHPPRSPPRKPRSRPRPARRAPSSSTSRCTTGSSSPGSASSASSSCSRSSVRTSPPTRRSRSTGRSTRGRPRSTGSARPRSGRTSSRSS